MMNSLHQFRQRLRAWLNQKKQQPIRGQARRLRLRLEELENRLAPSAPGVNTSTALTALVNGASAGVITYGTPITLCATVAAQSGTLAPSLGSVDFVDFTANLDLGVISTNTLSGTNAVFQLVTTPNELQVLQASGGVHNIFANYLPGNNFKASFATLSGGLTVNPASLTIMAMPNTKVYDSTSTAAAVPTVSGLIGNDTVTALKEVYADKNAGSSKTVSISTYTINDGNSGNNYAVTAVQANAGLINPAPLTVTGTTTGTWTAPAAMNSERLRQSATLLPNGQVLVAGGYIGSSYSSGTLATTEIYNPATDSWSPAASMTTARWAAGSTLLPNGKVLVVGGGGTNGLALASAEIYDPAANTWSSAGTMSAGRWLPTTILLPSGKVLVAGGTWASANAELYDPATNTWSLAGSVGILLQGQRGALLANGQVLITGGENNNFNVVANCELYNPSTNTWTSAASMANTRDEGTLTLLPNNLLLAVGGFNNSTNSSNNVNSSAEIYNPATNTWSPAASMNAARGLQTATLTPSGQVFVSGGEGPTSNLSSAEIYNPSSNSWSSVAPMATSRYFQSATLLPSGQILVAGGNSASTSGTSQLISPLNVAIANSKVYDGTSTATLNPNGLVLSGVYPGDTVLLSSSGAVGTFASKDVGNNLTVTTSGFTTSGPSATNYLLIQPTPTVFITPAPLTVTGLTPSANNKVYDGTTTASFTLGIPVLQGIIAGDSVVTTGGIGTFAGKNVGTSLTVTLAGLALGGAQGGDYVVNLNSISMTANITPAPLTIAAVANTKTYTSTTAASATPTVTGLKSGDTVTGLVEVYADRNAASGKTLSLSAYTVNDGNSGKNYSISTASNATGIIAPASLTLFAEPTTKTYDSTTSASVKPAVTGLLGGDSVTGLADVFADANAASGKTLSISTYTVSDGNNGGNYSVTKVHLWSPLQLRRCSRKDFQHEVFVPTAAAAFHRDAVLERMLFQ